MTKPDYIASDVHLGAVPGQTERNFVAFLDHAGRDAGTVLINGDLFDFWFEYGEVIPGKHFRVLAALSKLVDAGVRVILMGGNHDAWGGRFLREEVGVEYHTGLLRTRLGGKVALIAHGDGLGKGDFRYRALKSVVRSRVIIGLFRAIHPEVGLKIARGVSRTDTRQDDDAMRGRAKFLEDWGAARLAEDNNLSFVVCGHAHFPACVRVGPGRYYLNAGDWIRHNTYIYISAPGEPSLMTWPPAPQAA
ncbi:MAG: UDP-2,3-diacylglucosamine diphosphatase [Gemmatimonadota bacterium]